MKFSICSYSFHRQLEAGKQDIFKYISDCKELGCSGLDPWNAHFQGLQKMDEIKKNYNPDDVRLNSADVEYLDRIKRTASDLNMPFVCIAVDGAHIYEKEKELMSANRTYAHYWLKVAERLGAEQIRIDCGGTAEMPNEMFDVIVKGYNELIATADRKGIGIIIENHWGASPVPENLVKILDAVKGLGLLFDTNNWAEGMQSQGWDLCRKYAKTTHIKTFSFDENGNEPSVDIPKVVSMLVDSGYNGYWGIESCPVDGNEYDGAKKTIALVRRTLEGISK